MYGEEVDLCLRARKRDARPHIAPRATIIHFGGGSEPSTEGKVVKILKGRITVMKVHWHPVSLLLGRWIILATVAVRAMGSRIIRPPQRRGAGLDGRTDLWGRGAPPAGIGSTDRFAGAVFATLYQQLGIDPGATVLHDISGRPQRLVDTEYLPIGDLI